MSEYKFQPGDVIVPLSGPFVKTLNDSQKGQVCDNCFQPGNLVPCKGCRLMHYCGEKCQKVDWKEGHSVECKSETFKKVGQTESVLPIDVIRRVMRTVAKFHLDPGSFSEKHLVYGKLQRSFNDMMAHVGPNFKDKRLSLSMRRLYLKLKHNDTSYRAVNFDENFLRRVGGVWKTNAFGILSTDEKRMLDLGAGLFIAHSAFDHSCRPNATWHQGQLGKEIRCIHPIKKGEKPTISYLGGNPTLKERQSELKGTYHFTCVCELCTAEISGPLVDYSKLEPSSLDAFTSYSELFAHRQTLLELLRKLYHEYDSRITLFCCSAFKAILEFQKMARVGKREPVPRSVLWKEAMDIEKRLMITFGKQADFYIRFQRKLNELEIELTMK